MLDVHVIIAPDTPRGWVTQCLDSVHEAIDRAGFPIALHLAPFVEGHVGRARAGGYALGSHPYVAHVDDDDYLLPHAFEQMGESLKNGVSAVCTPELVLQNGRIRVGRPRHHLIAYRRDTLIDHTSWVCCGDMVQVASIGPDAIDLPCPGYVYRVYGKSRGRGLIRENIKELERARVQSAA